MRVGRGGEFGRRLPSSKIENNGQPVDSMLINLTILNNRLTILGNSSNPTGSDNIRVGGFSMSFHHWRHSSFVRKYWSTRNRWHKLAHLWHDSAEGCAYAALVPERSLGGVHYSPFVAT
jgi:hypothetical protein